MIPNQIPSVGTVVSFGDNPKKCRVKSIAPELQVVAGEFKETGNGVVIVKDDYGYEYAVPFDRFIPKEKA